MFKDVPETSPVIQKEIGKIKDRVRQFDDTPEVAHNKVREGRIQVNADSLIQGIVFAEVLGPPRSKKPWQYKH
jgi:hypothetical protein